MPGRMHRSCGLRRWQSAARGLDLAAPVKGAEGPIVQPGPGRDPFKVETWVRIPLGSCSVQPPGDEPGGCFFEFAVAEDDFVHYHSTNTVNDEPAQLDLTMTALSHPTRRAILERVM